MSDIREATLYWHGLLHACADPEALVDDLLTAQGEQGLSFGDRPFCTVARPRFVSAAQMLQEHRAVTALSTALRKVRDAVLGDDELRGAHFGRFDEWAGAILSLEPHGHEAWSILRFDSFLTGAGLRFVEVNGDIPMGSVCNDRLVPLFQRLPLFADFKRRYEVRPNLVQIGMIQTFMHAWQGWGGAGTPRICVLSFPGGMQDVFARLNADDMAAMGLEAVAAYPEDLEFADGTLRAKGRVVDLVYRIMHVADCLKRVDDLAPLFRALKAEAVCMVNPFRSAVISHKCLFALLTDDGCDFGFTGAERTAVREHVPWGRVMSDGPSTGPDGGRIDLVDYVLAHRDELVIKPAHEAGGAGVCLGWAGDAAAWAGAVNAALESDCIVQQRVDEARAQYPLLEKGFALESFFEDTDPFGFPGGYSAVLDRISSAEITNVARGGSIVPTFVVDAR